MHGDNTFNHWMEQTSAYYLFYTTMLYLQNHEGHEKICTNDMALPFAGKFDIHRTWLSPHFEHDRGDSVDVAGPGAMQCPNNYEVNVQEFLLACGANSAVRLIDEGNHAHCGWFDPGTYPN